MDNTFGALDDYGDMVPWGNITWGPLSIGGVSLRYRPAEQPRMHAVLSSETHRPRLKYRRQLEG